MKYILLILVFSGCASMDGISYKNDEAGIWHWSDKDSFYSVGWKVDSFLNEDLLEELFKARASSLCLENVLDANYHGTHEINSNLMTGGGGNIYATYQQSDLYAGGTVRCSEKPKHVSSHELKK